jgi:hypothetical protein
MELNNPQPAEVARVAVRLPSFRIEQPASWFTQAEAQFHLAVINNEPTKFYHVVSQLDERITAEVNDINMSPPQTGPLHLSQDRAYQAGVPFERPAHPPTLHSGDGGPAAFTVPASPQEPRA